MGRHSDDSGPAYVAPKPPRSKVLVLALLLTATLVAWGVLVYAAIDFGGQARGGESSAWVLVGVTTLGAAACLFTSLLLGSRVLALLQGRQAPARPQGGRRAAR